MKSKILIVDNNPNYLKTISTVLKVHGYDVLAAQTSDEANLYLSDQMVDLAIFDIRLIDDSSSHDVSGLQQARLASEKNIPTIILTSEPNYTYVRQAQTWFPLANITNITFVGKPEGEEVLVNVVKESLRSDKVFIVHGHDTPALNEMKSFIFQIGLRPIILGEQISGGLTLIDKFIRYASQVDYVIVLLTGDDIGGKKDGEMRPRARQNVIFELGFFIGKYSIGMVKALVVGDVEKPSDYQGVVYINMSNDEKWKAELVKEMQAWNLRVQYP